MSDTPRTDVEVSEWIDRTPDAGELRELIDFARQLERENAELVEALRELVARCDGAEGVRADGSNIQTHKAHGLLAKLGEA